MIQFFCRNESTDGHILHKVTYIAVSCIANSSYSNTKLTQISLVWKHSVQLRFVNEIKAGQSLKTQITILSLVYKCIPKRLNANKSANNFFNKRRGEYYCWNVSWFEKLIEFDKLDTVRIKIKVKSILFREKVVSFREN